jgi:hypothetical protein
MTGKSLCLICGESIAILKEYNIAKYYNSKHKEKYKKIYQCSERRKMATLKNVGSESQQNVFRKQSSESSSALRASYHVSH